MKNDQNLLLLKEKLKTKDREITKLQNYKQEWEGQVKSKISEMEGVIAEQQKIIETTGKEISQEKENSNKGNEPASSELSNKIEKERSKYKYFY